MKARKGHGKSSGTRIVEKYRPKMNKLSDAERQDLMTRAMQLVYGQPTVPHTRRR